MYENLAVLALFAFVYSLIGAGLARTPINGPLLYLLFGVIAGKVGLGLLDVELTGETIRSIAELTLSLVLYTDAANADLSVLRRTVAIPRKLLLLGLPLTILAGIGVGRILFPNLTLLEVAILATMLAPTDAALGKAVVSNPVVPAPVREGLNVESGLNDGICVPILLTFLALATHSARGAPFSLAFRFVLEEIGIGVVVGVGLALVGVWGVNAAAKRGWLVEPWRRMVVVALAMASFGLAQSLDGSGFIACFSGGLTFGALVHHHKGKVLEAAEWLGETFSMITWVLFGAQVVLQHRGVVDWNVVLYAVLSLTVVRIIPVVLCLSGLRLDLTTKLFLGWFGPRGLASIVFLVMVVQADLPGIDTIMATTVVTIVLSVLAHGLTANPLSKAFGSRQARLESAR